MGKEIERAILSRTNVLICSKWQENRTGILEEEFEKINPTNRKNNITIAGLQLNENNGGS